MESATDSATDQVVSAAGALATRRYICSRCQAPVKLRSGSEKVTHFAHVAGRADPDCEVYFPSSGSYAARRLRREANDDVTKNVAGCDLLFDVDASGPKLYIWLPPTDRSDSWGGSVTVVAHQLTRRLSAQHLSRGQLIGFSLADGQWSINVEGQLSDEYLSKLDIGPASLQATLNVFSADNSPGRQFGSSQAIRLGDSVWAITRRQDFPSHQAASFASLKRYESVAGWNVFLVNLPASESIQAIRGLSDWLQHPIRPARAKVWIERPWPISVSPEGIPTLPSSAGSVNVVADALLDIEVRDCSGLVVASNSRGFDRCVWENPQPGLWKVFANDVWFFDFCVCLDFDVPQPAMSVSVNGGAFTDLFDGQEQTDKVLSSNITSVDLVLRWGTSRVAAVGSLNGVQLEAEEHKNQTSLTMRLGDRLRFGNLGSIILSEPSDVINPDRATLDTRIITRAKWLASVGSYDDRGHDVTLAIPARLHASEMFSRLARLHWSMKYVAHVRDFERRLKSIQ